VTAGEIRLTVDGVSAIAVLRPETAPTMVAALRSVLPFESSARQAIWSGHAATIALPGDFVLSMPETAVSLVDVGVIAIPETGNELLVAYGPCVALDATGPLRATRVGHLVEGIEPLLDRLARLVTAGATSARIELA